MNILFRPRFPGFHPAEQHDSDNYRQLVQSWMTVFPESTSNEAVDFEDWVENAVRLESAMRVFPDANLIIINRDNETFQDGRKIDIPEEGLFIGIYKNHDPSFDHLVDKAMNAMVGNYALTETFKRFAGRRYEMCGVNAKNSPGLLHTIKDFVDSGIHDIFIKVNRQKYQIERLRFNSVQDVEDKFYDSATALAAMHLEERDNAFQVQQFIQMLYEYRMIVVDHELVSGAGCIEEFTPLNNFAKFDNQLRKDRSARSEVVEDQSIVDRYIQFGRQFVASMKSENPAFSDYTLDVALDDNGTVVPVECNPPDNFGLYAMDYDEIIKALAEKSNFDMERAVCPK